MFGLGSMLVLGGGHVQARMPISAVPRFAGAILAGVVVATIAGLAVNPGAAALVGIAAGGVRVRRGRLGGAVADGCRTDPPYRAS